MNREDIQILIGNAMTVLSIWAAFALVIWFLS